MSCWQLYPHYKACTLYNLAVPNTILTACLIVHKIDIASGKGICLSRTAEPDRNLIPYLAVHKVWQAFLHLGQLSLTEIWQHILQFLSSCNLCSDSWQILGVCLCPCTVFCSAVWDWFRCVLHTELCLVFCFPHYLLQKESELTPSDS